MAVCSLAVQALGREGWTVPFGTTGSLHKMKVFMEVWLPKMRIDCNGIHCPEWF